MTLSPQAIETLVELDLGKHMNTVHSVCRELIAAGMASDDWGRLEITEKGRLVVRQMRFSGVRQFLVDDPNISNMGDFNRPAPLPPVAPEIGSDLIINNMEVTQETGPTEPRELPLYKREGSVAWSRERARQAAGVANGKSGVWIEATWIDAFLDAYEEIDCKGPS